MFCSRVWMWVEREAQGDRSTWRQNQTNRRKIRWRHVRQDRGQGTHTILTVPAGRERDRERQNKSERAKVEENWVSRYKTLVPQLFMAISLTCLAVAADVSSACSVLHSYLPVCQIRPWHTEEQDAELLAGSEATEFSIEIVTGKKLGPFQGISDSVWRRCRC